MEEEVCQPDYLSALSYERLVPGPSPEIISVCKCILPDAISEEEILSERKRKVLSVASRTENYLHERRIPDFMNYFLAKIIADSPYNPRAYCIKLLDECMLFRAGHGTSPVVYENRHLKAVIKSFDPGDRGWLTAAQARRAFSILGLNANYMDNEKIPVERVFDDLYNTQEQELYNLLNAGMNVEKKTSEPRPAPPTAPTVTTTISTTYTI